MNKNQNPSDMNLKSVLNFRDIGGIVSDGDKKIKDGIIFRSANPDGISKGDIKKLHLLNIRTIIDLRAPHEHKRQKRSIDHIDRLSLPLDFAQITREKFKPLLNKKNSEVMISDISNSLYLEILDATQQMFKDVMEVLLSSERCPVLIHCQAGKDRTGIICALILLALGAERQLIIDDFLKSNDALLPFFKKMVLRRKILSFGFFPSRAILFAITVRKRNIESVLDRIADHFGGIEAFLKDSGVDTSRLTELKKKLFVK
ncbi:MAG: tyrosine-protein phosphatase [Bacteroidota bacterium]